jgi:hypothetical protein
MIIYEIMRQITSEEKALLILSRYGLSKLLNAIKLHSEQKEIRRLLEDFVCKLVKSGHRNLSVSVLFKMGTSQDVKQIHPGLQDTAWECLVSLSETFDSQQNTLQFENFIPELIRWIKSHLMTKMSQPGFFYNEAVSILSNLSLRSNLR